MRVLHYTRLEKLARDKYFSLLAHSYVTEKMNCCESGQRHCLFITLHRNEKLVRWQVDEMAD
jgi:hypothetical protein